jgi:hypothetical protein
MPAVRTTGELYPATTSVEMHQFMSAVITGERDDRYNAILRRALTPAERQALTKRAGEIAPLLERAQYRKSAKIISEMLAGFGSSRASEDEAEVVAAQYAAALAGHPLWAIERACGRFSRGEVDADEVGAKHLDRAFAPSTAQLAMIAKKIVKPFEDDLIRIKMICGGTVVPEEISPEERERVGKKVAAFAAERRREEDSADEERRQSTQRSLENTRNLVLAEYRQAGIAPVYSDNGTLCSISLYRSLGYTIEEIDGRRALVAPAKAAAP